MAEALLLLGSVLTQAVAVAATRASDGLRRCGWVVTAFTAMAASVALMSRAIAHGLPLAVGYGTWSGSGIAASTAAGVLVFGDRVAREHLLGLVLVVVGTVLVHGGG